MAVAQVSSRDRLNEDKLKIYFCNRDAGPVYRAHEPSRYSFPRCIKRDVQRGERSILKQMLEKRVFKFKFVLNEISEILFA